MVFGFKPLLAEACARRTVILFETKTTVGPSFQFAQAGPIIVFVIAIFDVIVVKVTIITTSDKNKNKNHQHNKNNNRVSRGLN